MAEPAQTKSLEQRVGIFESVGKTLEGLVTDVKQLAVDSVFYGYYGAKAAAGIAAGLAIAGTPRILTFPLGMALGSYLNKKISKTPMSFKDSYKHVMNELAVGGVLAGFLNYLFKGVGFVADIFKANYGKMAGLAAGALGSLATTPGFMATHEYLNRFLVSGYESKPLKDIPKNMFGPLLPTLPLVMANYSVVPEYLGPTYQMPVASGISTLYGMLKGGNKKKEEKTPLPQPGMQYAGG
ncbi:MAG TPA: hypothetical protein VFF28_02915 [Candidatus Nanoarchaeia archaeon]|nr:hypothetical protein [Candidatus Nanoarchaeia archaeon]